MFRWKSISIMENILFSWWSRLWNSRNNNTGNIKLNNFNATILTSVIPTIKFAETESRNKILINISHLNLYDENDLTTKINLIEESLDMYSASTEDWDATTLPFTSSSSATSSSSSSSSSSLLNTSALSTIFNYDIPYNNSDIFTNFSISSGNSFLLNGFDESYDDRQNEELLMNMLFNCSNTTDCCSLNNRTAIKTIALNQTGAANCTGSDGSYELDAAIQYLTILGTAAILGLIILATVIGNVFVIAAILLERHLQSVANYLILSLAVADLLVACLVMPLSAVYEVSKEWKLGPELCDMWTSSDVLCCTASILHLVAIALDRYWAVTNIDYIHQRTARRIGVMILIIWALSFLVSIAPILGWKDPKWNERVSIELKCIVSQDIGYQIFATASSFYVPLMVILILYWRIFQTARKRIRRRQQAAQTHPEPLANASCLALTAIGFRWKVTATQPTSGGLIATAAGGSGGIAAAVVTVIGRPLPTISETTTAFTNISSTHTSPEKGSYGNGVDRIENDPSTADISTYGAAPASSFRPTIVRKKTQTSVDSKRERKAAKTLAIITGAFVCCWLPFFILAILLPVCQCDISPLAMSFSLWLGYFNSTLNPLIYTIFSPEFRHAFKRILCGKRNSIRRRGRCTRR